MYEFIEADAYPYIVNTTKILTQLNPTSNRDHRSVE